MNTETQQLATEQQALRLFVRRVMMFVLPAVLVVAPAVTILAWSGESFRNVDDALVQLDEQPLLTGYAYNEFNYGYLKFSRLTSLPRQTVVALGSSRVLAFREEMFRSSFYNAGYTVSPVEEFREFLSNVPDRLSPEILIIGVDQWMFNRTWIDQSRTDKSRWTTNQSDSLQLGLKTIPKLYKDVVRGKLSFSGPKTEDGVVHVGLNAICNQKGFRNDGSFSYGNQVEQLLKTDPLNEDLPLRRSPRFAPSNVVDKEARQELKELLDYCADRGIRVVGFLPPFMDRLYERMLASGEHEYVRTLGRELRPLFEEQGFEFHEFQSMRSCDSDDSEAIDEIHGSDVTYVRLLLRMLEQGTVLADHIDQSTLMTQLAQRQNRYCVSCF